MINYNAKSITVYFYTETNYLTYSTAYLYINPSYDYWLSVSRSIYTDDLAEKMVRGMCAVYVHNGKVYNMGAVFPQWFVFSIDYEEYYEDIEHLKDYKLNINVENKGNEAIIGFDYINAFKSPFMDDFFIERTYVNAVYVDGSWKISGGGYVDIILDTYYRERVFLSPQTGDDMYVYLLVAVISGGGALLIYKYINSQRAGGECCV